MVIKKQNNEKQNADIQFSKESDTAFLDGKYGLISKYIIFIIACKNTGSRILSKKMTKFLNKPFCFRFEKNNLKKKHEEMNGVYTKFYERASESFLFPANSRSRSFAMTKLS